MRPDRTKPLIALSPATRAITHLVPINSLLVSENVLRPSSQHEDVRVLVRHNWTTRSLLSIEKRRIC